MRAGRQKYSAAPIKRRERERRSSLPSQRDFSSIKVAIARTLPVKGCAKGKSPRFNEEDHAAVAAAAAAAGCKAQFSRSRYARVTAAAAATGRGARGPGAKFN
jgi:hypothetical protein